MWKSCNLLLFVRCRHSVLGDDEAWNESRILQLAGFDASTCRSRLQKCGASGWKRSVARIMAAHTVKWKRAVVVVVAAGPSSVGCVWQGRSLGQREGAASVAHWSVALHFQVRLHRPLATRLRPDTAVQDDAADHRQFGLPVAIHHTVMTSTTTAIEVDI